jgi:REP element-mobilizing transposase RayT
MKIYRGNHLRIGRVAELQRPYLITTATRDRKPVFADWHIGRLLAAELHKTAQCGYAETLAWVIIPDHLHWLMMPNTESLDAVVRRVKSRSARSICRASGTRGALWQKGYHDRAVRRNEDVRAMARYIIANPLRAGLAESVGDYPLWDTAWL